MYEYIASFAAEKSEAWKNGTFFAVNTGTNTSASYNDGCHRDDRALPKVVAMLVGSDSLAQTLQGDRFSRRGQEHALRGKARNHWGKEVYVTPPFSDTPGEEESLVQSAKAGDDTAFDQLCRWHISALCAYVTHMTGNYEDAQQLTQEIFLAAWQDLPHLQSTTAFKSWLYCIATHRILDWVRRRRRFEWLSWEEDIFHLEQCDFLQGNNEAAPDEQVISKGGMPRIRVKFYHKAICYIFRERHR